MTTQITYDNASPSSWKSNLAIDWEILNTDFVRQAMCGTIFARSKNGGGPLSIRMRSWSGNKPPEMTDDEYRAEFERFIGEITNNMTRFTIALEADGWTHQGFLNDDEYISVSYRSGYGTVTVLMMAPDEVLIPEKIVNVDVWTEKYFTAEQSKGTVYMLMAGSNGPEFMPAGQGGEKLTRENYTPDVIEAFDRICKELTVSDPRGRLSVVSGPPGTGKTYLIRALLQEITGAIFAIVPQGILPELVAPTGLTSLYRFRENHRNSPIVLILEDADDALAPRQDSGMNIISALLNMSDGITGKLLDLRVVATTNREQQEFDAAIMRPGRLSTATVVGKLPREQALEVYRRLMDDPKAEIDLPKEISISEIYQRAYDKGWMPAKVAKSRRVGFGA